MELNSSSTKRKVKKENKIKEIKISEEILGFVIIDLGRLKRLFFFFFILDRNTSTKQPFHIGA